MTITSVETKILRAPLKRPFVTALRRVEALEDIVVLIHTDTGHIGYGEGAPTALITGETQGTMKAAIEHIAPLLTGRDIEEFDTLVATISRSLLHNTTAKSALEIALYDLRAKSLNLPLFGMLGGTQRRFESDITISLGSTEQMVADSLAAKEEGYRILKVKVGDSDTAKDIERVTEIHRALPADTVLRLDANQGWSREQSVEVMQRLEAGGILPQLLEQPVHYRDTEALRYIRERISTPLLADEALFDSYDARRLLDQGACDYLNIKLDKCGGITKALEIADIARECGVRCMMGCMLEGPIAINAALHVVSARADTITMLDLDAIGLCASVPTRGGAAVDGAWMELGDGIGLGMEF